MTHYTPITRMPTAAAPTLEGLAAKAVRLGRETAAAAQDAGVGVSPQDWRRLGQLLEALAERLPFAACDETIEEARRILERDIGSEEAGTERRVVDYDVDPDGRRLDVLAEVPAHTERGRTLLQVQQRLREFIAARDAVLDRIAAERAVRDLMGGGNGPFKS